MRASSSRFVATVTILMTIAVKKVEITVPHVTTCLKVYVTLWVKTSHHAMLVRIGCVQVEK